MGYMGFGMRKEVYTKKPKDAFDKLKTYGNDGARDKEDVEVSLNTYEEIMAFHRKRSKRSPWRVILNLMLFLGMVAFIAIELYYLLSHLSIILTPFIF